jgi:hypothetical protein
MTSRRLHRLIGLTLLLPFLGWVITAFIFYFKPGYDQAYESLRFKTYPFEAISILPTNPQWREIRYFRTILGIHVCVRTEDTWIQLDPVTLEARPEATEEELRILLIDAFSSNPDRYGSIATISDDGIVTTTGVRITVDWDRMALYQRGADTDLIDLLYKVHYLQWTGFDAVDKILGPLGLLLILTLSILGIKLSLKKGDQ